MAMTISIFTAAVVFFQVTFALPQFSFYSAPADISSAYGYGESAPPLLPITNAVSHGPFSGTATVTGALTQTILAASVSPQPVNPKETEYIAKQTAGVLVDAEVAPYTPSGGLGTDGTLPFYRPQSDFDYESLVLVLYQEWIELDLFHYGLATFSEEDFTNAGLTAEDRFLLEFMADQEAGHATLISNILGDGLYPFQCTYNYPVTNVQDYVDFSQKLTRFGESGVYGFLNHLDSREAGQLLLQSISTEARQQMIFRQFSGLFPMPVWFEVGIPQSWAWTLLAPYITSCPADNIRLAWQNFPGLTVLNQPNLGRINANRTNMGETIGSTGAAPSNITAVPPQDSCKFDCGPAITHNRSIPLSFPGRQVFFAWEDAGMPVGPNNSYITNTTASEPCYVIWTSQLNITYSHLTVTGPNHGYTFQPDLSTYAGDPAINGTIFVALTSQNITVSPFNLSMINPFIYAGPAIYQAG